MHESIHRYFQVGTIQWMSHPQRDVVQSIYDIAQDDFFDAIEITEIADDETRRKARGVLAQTHLKICYAAQTRLIGRKLNPNDLNEEGRKRAEMTLIEGIDEAEFLGAGGIGFLAGQWARETEELAYSQLLKTTHNICAYAKEKGMLVELEVFDYDMDKAVLIGPAPLAARFAADVRTRHSNFGLIVDLSHIPTTYETSAMVIRTLRPYITHFHIGNAVVKKGCEAYGDKHPRFGFPNSANDTIELLDFLRVLKCEGFFDAQNPYVLSMEVKPWCGEDEELILSNTKRVINRAWALLED